MNHHLPRSTHNHVSIPFLKLMIESDATEALASLNFSDQKTRVTTLLSGPQDYGWLSLETVTCMCGHSSAQCTRFAAVVVRMLTPPLAAQGRMFGNVGSNVGIGDSAGGDGCTDAQSRYHRKERQLGCGSSVRLARNWGD